MAGASVARGEDGVRSARQTVVRVGPVASATEWTTLGAVALGSEVVACLARASSGSRAVGREGLAGETLVRVSS